MTGRQSVLGPKAASRVRSFIGQLACSFIPVLLLSFRGVQGAIGETCSSTPWWPLLLGLGVFRVMLASSSAAFLPFLNWGHGAHCTLDFYLAALIGLFYPLERWHVVIYVGRSFRVSSGWL